MSRLLIIAGLLVALAGAGCKGPEQQANFVGLPADMQIQK
jgi:hypothetical protein